MKLENALCVRFWWEAGALNDVQTWFNYRIYSQGWCCHNVYPLPLSIPVFGDFINYLISKILRSKLILHSCSYQYTTVCIAFWGKYVSYLLWMKLLGAPVISTLCLWIGMHGEWTYKSWKWLIYLDTSCFWLKNKALRNYLVRWLLIQFYREFLWDLVFVWSLSLRSEMFDFFKDSSD